LAIAQIRKTGRIADVIGEFAVAQSELTQAWRILLQKDRAQAVLPLLRSADCVRIMQRWDEAKKRYEEAIPLSRDMHSVDLEAKAWFGIAKVERIGKVNQDAAADANRGVHPRGGAINQVLALWIRRVGSGHCDNSACGT
jgi:hypothetical protein